MDYNSLYEGFDNRIRDFEESISRLTTAAAVAYDKKHHMEVTKEYAAILMDLKSSSLKEEDKGVFSTMIVELLREARVDIKYV